MMTKPRQHRWRIEPRPRPPAYTHWIGARLMEVL
jgi:hypothetical protein